MHLLLELKNRYTFSNSKNILIFHFKFHCILFDSFMFFNKKIDNSPFHLYSHVIMFTALDNNKIMTYISGQEVSYHDLLQKIIAIIPIKDGSNLEQSFKRCVHEVAEELFVTSKTTNVFLSDFCNVVKSILTDAVQGRKPDGTFYCSLAFDMKEEMVKNNKSECIRLFGGLNARRIMNGKKPLVDYMPTTTLIQAHCQLYDLGYVPSKESQYFLDKYAPIIKYNELVDDVKNSIKHLGLHFAFKKSKNPVTGANMYDIDNGVQKWREIKQKMDNFKYIIDPKVHLNEMTELLNSFDFSKASEFQKGVIYWNLSEYLSKFHCYLVDAFNESYEFITDCAMYNEIINRSRTGDFPGDEVNNDVIACPLSKLFFME